MQCAHVRGRCAGTRFVHAGITHARALPFQPSVYPPRPRAPGERCTAHWHASGALATGAPCEVRLPRAVPCARNVQLRCSASNGAAPTRTPSFSVRPLRYAEMRRVGRHVCAAPPPRRDSRAPSGCDEAKLASGLGRAPGGRMSGRGSAARWRCSADVQLYGHHCSSLYGPVLAGKI